MDLNLSDEQKLLRESAERFVAGSYNADHRRKMANDPLGFSPAVWKQFAEARLAGAANPRGVRRARRRRGRDRHFDGGLRPRAGVGTLYRDCRAGSRADRKMRHDRAEAGEPAQGGGRIAEARLRAFRARGAIRPRQSRDISDQIDARLAPVRQQDRGARRPRRRRDHRLRADPRPSRPIGTDRPVRAAGDGGRPRDVRLRAPRRRARLQHRAVRGAPARRRPAR